MILRNISVLECLTRLQAIAAFFESGYRILYRIVFILPFRRFTRKDTRVLLDSLSVQIIVHMSAFEAELLNETHTVKP